MKKTVLIGESSLLELEVARSCAERDLEIRTAVDLDLRDRSRVGEAIGDADRLVLIRPPRGAVPEATLVRVLGDAIGQGVEQIVLIAPVHTRLDEYLRDAAVDWTILRPTLLSQSLAEACRHDIVADDRVYLPAGDARAAFVDARDVGAVVASVLHTPSAHDHRLYHLTGPETFSFDEVAQLLTVSSGRAIRYQPATTLGYVMHLRAQGLSPRHSIDRAMPYLRLRWRHGDAVDPALAYLLGYRGRSLVDYVMEHGTLWRIDDPAASGRFAAVHP